MTPVSTENPPAISDQARTRRSGLWPNETGSIVPEFAFLLPVVLLVLTGAVQFGALFYLQDNMTSVAEETSQRVAAGQLTALEARRFAEDSLVNWGVAFAVEVSEPGREVFVNISAPLADAALIDMHGIFDGGTLRARSVAHKD